MAANFADGAEESFGRAGRLRTRALELAEVEMHAYEPVLEALRLRRDDPDRDARVDAARTEASRSPLEIARIGAELTELAGELARTGNPNLSGDALAAAVLAEAGVQAAARLVAINLTEGPAVEESSQLAQKALAARERALG
jgi:formiminotetrahydrofolate cyclodeaminase